MENCSPYNSVKVILNLKSIHTLDELDNMFDKIQDNAEFNFSLIGDINLRSDYFVIRIDSIKDTGYFTVAINKEDFRLEMYASSLQVELFNEVRRLDKAAEIETSDYTIFVNLRLEIPINIHQGVYSILQHMAEGFLLIGDKPVFPDENFFNTYNWDRLFSKNGTVTLENVLLHETKSVQKIFAINSFVPNINKDAVISFIQWILKYIQFPQQEVVIGYIDCRNACEIITNLRQIPVGM